MVVMSEVLWHIWSQGRSLSNAQGRWADTDPTETRIDNVAVHYSDIARASWGLKPPATRQFVQYFAHAYDQEKTKLRIKNPLLGKFTVGPVDSPLKSPLIQNISMPWRHHGVGVISISAVPSSAAIFRNPQNKPKRQIISPWNPMFLVMPNLLSLGHRSLCRVSFVSSGVCSTFVVAVGLHRAILDRVIMRPGCI